MSELTICNYCLLQKAKKKAKEKRQQITIRKNGDLEYFPKGLDVYMHPKGVTIPRGYTREDGDGGEFGKYFVMWMADIGESCCC